MPNRGFCNFDYFHPQGLHGVDGEVFLSLPAVLGASGVSHAVTQNLGDDEKEELQKSAKLMEEVQKGLTF